MDFLENHLNTESFSNKEQLSVTGRFFKMFSPIMMQK